MKKTYSAPYIERNMAGFINKFANQSVVNHQERIDNIPVSSLVENFGSPLFVFSETTIRRRYRHLLETMRMHYPNVEVSWSYKTNYLGAICNIYHQEGAKAEVVSGFEYEKARHNGVEGKNIIFNGPGKRKHEIQRAITEGSRLHIDHLDELYLIEKTAEEMDTIAEVAIRVNMDTGIAPMWTRFGFNYENGEAFRTIQRLLAGKRMKLVGLHTHIGTFILDANAYYWAAYKLLQLAQQVEDSFHFAVEYIDLGGGFASKNTLHASYTPGEYASPSFDQYATAIGNAFNESPFVREHNPVLSFETGRAMIDEAGFLIASVLGKKNLPTGERAIILDAGVNTNITAWWYKQKVTPTTPFPGNYQNTVFYGPLCMNIDLIRPASPFPELHTGDKVIISPVGAYNVTQWMQFIEYRPSVVLISETGKIELIREREDLSDVINREKVPEHLRKF